MADETTTTELAIDEAAAAIEAAEKAEGLNKETEAKEEFEVEDLPEMEPEAQDPEVDLKTALQQEQHDMLKLRQEFTEYRQQADNLIRMQQGRLSEQRSAPREVPTDDDDPWADPQERQPQRHAPQAGQSELQRDFAALKQEFVAMKSEAQQKTMRSDIENAAQAANEKFGMPLLDFENIVYEMQKHGGEMTASQAADRVARRKLASWKESGLVKRRARPAAPQVPPGLRAVRDYSEKTDAAGSRDEMEAQMDAYEALLGQHE